MAKQLPKIKDGMDYSWLRSCIAMSGRDPNNKGIGEITGLQNISINRRFENPDKWTRGEMLSIARKCNLNTYDIMRIFFNDYLITETEQMFYADLLQKMSDYLRESPGLEKKKQKQSETETKTLNLIRKLTDKVDTLQQEIRELKKSAD